MKYVNCLILFSFFVSPKLFSQIPADFKLKNVFQLDSSTLENYAYSINSAQDWQVIIDNDSLKVIKYTTKNKGGMSFPPNFDSKTWIGVKGQAVSVKVFNGWIVGLDAGEWGGDLRWYSSNGKQIDTIYGMVHQIDKFDDRLFAISGMYHMSIAEGNLLEIKFDGKKNKWHVETYYKCKGYPFVFTIIDSNIYILTSSDLIKIDQKKDVHFLIKNGFWNLAYPNSMKFYKGSIYIGMRGGILKITDNNESITKEWFEKKVKIY